MLAPRCSCTAAVASCMCAPHAASARAATAIACWHGLVPRAPLLSLALRVAVQLWFSPRLLLAVPIRLVLFLCSFVFSTTAFFAWQVSVMLATAGCPPRYCRAARPFAPPLLPCLLAWPFLSNAWCPNPGFLTAAAAAAAAACSLARTLAFSRRLAGCGPTAQYLGGSPSSLQASSWPGQPGPPSLPSLWLSTGRFRERQSAAAAAPCWLQRCMHAAASPAGSCCQREGSMRRQQQRQLANWRAAAAGSGLRWNRWLWRHSCRPRRRTCAPALPGWRPAWQRRSEPARARRHQLCRSLGSAWKLGYLSQ